MHRDSVAFGEKATAKRFAYRPANQDSGGEGRGRGRSSVLAQLLFVGVTQAAHCPNLTDCAFAGTCDDVAGCHMIMCDFGGPGACVHV